MSDLKLSDSASRADEMSEKCSHSLRGDKGAQSEFIRKRKRAFHRAIRRGDTSKEVLKWHSDKQMKDFLNSQINSFSNQIINHITKPHPIWGLVEAMDLRMENPE